MKTLLATLGLLLATAVAFPQVPVRDPVDVVYRTAVNYNGGTDTLRLRVWIPEGTIPEELSNLVVWVHGGAFYEGSYEAMDSICKHWAEQGYVAASVQYRLGFYTAPLLDLPFAYDRAEVVRACWRGTQDIRAALRYLVDNSGQFLFSPQCITMGGESAGSILVLQSLIQSPTDSVPREVNQLGDVVHGFDRFPRPDLGPLDPPEAGPLPTVHTVLNRYGAIMHPYMLQASDLNAVYSYHQRGDRIVACGVDKGLWGLPFGPGANFPTLWGSCAMVNLFDEVSLDDSKRETFFVDGIGHNLHDRALVRERELAFAARQGCGPLTGVKEVKNTNDNSRADEWVAYDVLGRLVDSGTGGFKAAFQSLRYGNHQVLIVICGGSVKKIVF